MNQSLTLLDLPVVLLALGSIAFWAWAFAQKASNRHLLPIVPRQDVPWRGWEVAAVMGLVMWGPAVQIAGDLLGIEFGGGAEAGGAEAESQPISAVQLIFSSLSMLGFVAALMLVLCVARRASAEDLGLGRSPIARGIGIGAAGFVAALLPVYSIQLVLMNFYPPEESQHQILELLQNKQGTLTLVAAVFSAAIVAPIVEEFLFRAFFQGWLEARFLRGWADIDADATDADAIERALELESAREESGEGQSLDLDALLQDVMQAGLGESPQIAEDDSENPFALPVDSSLASGEDPQAAEAFALASYRVPPAILSVLPILISSTAFALAHFDNWPAPIPLFALALILGYTYHRTHRLLPCIVIHMLFNSLSLALVWWVS